MLAKATSGGANMLYALTVVFAVAMAVAATAATPLPSAGQSHHWVVHVHGGIEVAEEVAALHNLRNHGQVQ